MATTGGSGGASVGGGTAALGGSAPAAGAAAVSTGGVAAIESGGAAGAAGDPLERFCTGTPRVSFQGETVYPAVTSAAPMTRSCCFDFSVRLHTRSWLEMDLIVDLSFAAGGVEEGEYLVDESGWPSATVRTSSDSAGPSQIATGTLGLFDSLSRDTPWDVALCLEVEPTSSALGGTRIHVPRVTMAPYTWQDRFEIYLLEDASLTAEDTVGVPLDSLAIASDPLVTMSDMEFVDETTGWVQLLEFRLSGETLRSEVGDVSVFGLPFVVMSQGVRTYLGAFGTMASSYLPSCPMITVELIESTGFTIEPPPTGSDPRHDPQLVQALAEASRLVPAPGLIP